jgi:threonine synthase
MKFYSTRGHAPEANIRDIALAGLAPDGGLYLPKSWPQFSSEDIAAMRGKRYQDVAFQVLRPFMRGAIPDTPLRAIIEKSYASFESPDVVPVRNLSDDIRLLELFHGPTLAFKDVALQLLGNVFGYLMQESGERMTVIVATSGDTGSAAISALANLKNIEVFVLYPNIGPSDIQRKQMTCVDAPNVHAIAIDGTFDDCQAIVKALFADEKLRKHWNLNTVNSINLMRILAQIVYYFTAAQKVEGRPTFVVPTGNFGDVFAGYAAMKCGLPIEKLVVATNSNDILARFFAKGTMNPEGVHGTLSPSMDIQISSNFERLLFDLCAQDATQVRGYMNDLKNKGSFAVSKAQLALAHTMFSAGSANDEETLATIADVYKKHNYILDPHTAVGVKVAQGLASQLSQPVFCLATADASKFPETIIRALGFAPPVPVKTAALIRQPERTTLLPAQKQRVADYIRKFDR